MEKSSFFNSINGDRKYKAQEFAEYFSAFIGNGIFPNPSNNLQVLANGDMTITVKLGKAWINGYFYANTDDLRFKLDIADGALNRIDRLVLRLDYLKREIKCCLKKGIFSEVTNQAPSVLRNSDVYELALADIKISKGAISISQSDITDMRLNKELCGIVHATVDQIDTTTLFNQYVSWYQASTQKATNDIEALKTNFKNDFNAWFNSIKGQLSGDVATNLINKIMDLEAKINDKDLKTFETDVSLTKLESCNGGFVEYEVQGNTEVNLYNRDLTGGWSVFENGVQLVTTTNQPRLYNIFKNNGVYSIQFKIHNGNVKGAWDVCDCGVGVIDAYDGWQTIRLDNFIHNKPDLATFNFIDLSFPAGTNLKVKDIIVLRGDWTGKEFPKWFQGMEHVGELVSLTPSATIDFSNKQIIDVPFSNIYATKIGDTFTWYGSNGSVYATNVKVINIVGNTLTLDFRNIFNGSANTNPSEKFVPTIPYYRIEILSSNKNLYKGLEGEIIVDRNPTISCREMFKCFIGRTVTISFDLKVDIPRKILIYPYQENGISISNGKNFMPTTSFQRFSHTTTIKDFGDNGIYTKGDIAFYDTAGDNKIYIKNIQIELNDKETPYEPYGSNKTEILIPQPLAEGNKIKSDGTFEIGSKELVLNDTSDVKCYLPNLSKYINTTGFYIYLPDIKPWLWVKSDSFAQIVDVWNGDIEGITNHYDNGNIYFNISNSKTGIVTTDTDTQRVQKLKNYLKTNNIKILYPLKDSDKKYINTNKTLIQKAYPGGYLQINCGAVQAHAKGTYATNISERAASMENAIEEIKDDVETLESAMLTVATEIADNGVYKNKAKNIDKTDINELFEGGIYCGTNLKNAPTSESYRLEIIPSSSGKEWCEQKLSRLQNPNEQFHRIYDPNISNWTEFIKFHYIYTKIPNGRPPILENGMMWLE